MRGKAGNGAAAKVCRRLSARLGRPLRRRESAAEERRQVSRLLCKLAELTKMAGA